MDCNKMEEIIFTDYIDGRLAGQALKDAQDHLASCSRCRDLASELASIGAEFKKSGHEEPPARLWERILSEINRPPPAAVFARDIFRSARLVFTRFRPAIAVCAAAALIFIVLWAGRIGTHTGTANLQIGEDEILSMVVFDENGTTDYGFGTPEENYFL